jgi:hypothetical protein
MPDGTATRIFRLGSSTVVALNHSELAVRSFSPEPISEVLFKFQFVPQFRGGNET